MARLIPAAERITKARALIQKARALPKPDDAGWQDFTYAAQVKDLLRQARDLVKFIPNSPSASAELKNEVANIFTETERTEKEILHKSL
jgi:hypothetical protein